MSAFILPNDEMKPLGKTHGKSTSRFEDYWAIPCVAILPYRAINVQVSEHPMASECNLIKAMECSSAILGN